MSERFLTRNPYFNDGRFIAPADLKGFILHSVGVGQPDPLVFIRAWDNPNYTNAGISGFIGPEQTYLTAPCMTPGNVKRMPHAGKRWVNDHYIGFEMTEPAQLRYTTGAKFTVTDRQAARGFVEKTYWNAVKLFAQLCLYHKKDPLTPGVILSHAEAGKQGIATTHADPEHLWQGLGTDFTMNRFRVAVAFELNGLLDMMWNTDRDTVLDYYWNVEGDKMNEAKLNELIDARIREALHPADQTVPAWAQTQYDAAIADGITDGTNPNAVPTRLEAALMAHRAWKKMEKDT